MSSELTIRARKLRTFPRKVAKHPKVLEKIRQLSKQGKRFLILSGPPGVGKTTAAEDFIYSVVDRYQGEFSVDESRLSHLFADFRTRVYSTAEIESVLDSAGVKFVWDMLVMHPQYAYEDLLRGYKVSTGDNGSTLVVREGILGFAARVVEALEERSEDSNEINGLIVLDEINRAPIGQLFGEAIYALDRRGSAANTPYELDGVGANISIPESLLLLGTMNSVDRATSGFDYALRRRFATIAIYPSEAPIEACWSQYSGSVGGLGIKLYRKIRHFIESSDEMGTIPAVELVPGPAYFIPPDPLSKDQDDAVSWLVSSYLFQIIPNLIDYREQGLLEFPETLVGTLPFSNLLSGSNIGIEESDSDLNSELIEFLAEVNESSPSQD